MTQTNQALGTEMLGLAEVLLVRGGVSAGAVGRHVPCAGLSQHNRDMLVCTHAEGMPSPDSLLLFSLSLGKLVLFLHFHQFLLVAEM